MTINDIPSDIQNIYVDVGLSYDAPNSNKWLKEDPNSFVFGFEPVPENCDSVISIINKGGFSKKFRLFQNAVDDQEGSRVFNITKNSIKGDRGQSSFFSPREGAPFSIEESIEVNCVSLRSLFNLLDWDRFKEIKILKTDTQGNDLVIMKDIVSFFDRIPYIICESHTLNSYANSNDDPGNMASFMTNHNYSLLSPLNHPDHIYKRK